MSLARGVTDQKYFNGVKQVFILKKKMVSCFVLLLWSMFSEIDEIHCVY